VTQKLEKNIKSPARSDLDIVWTRKILAKW